MTTAISYNGFLLGSNMSHFPLVNGEKRQFKTKFTFFEGKRGVFNIRHTWWFFLKKTFMLFCYFNILILYFVDTVTGSNISIHYIYIYIYMVTTI